MNGMHAARTLWRLIEPIHAVVYFDPACRKAFADAGLKGFWMGYFAGRAAPLGPVPAAVVSATFYNFHPSMVARAIPDAWSFAEPRHVLAARWSSVAAVLRRIAADADVGRANEALRPLVEHASGAGRPLFSANHRLDPGDDPFAQLWQLATALREHRGDGHVSLLVSEEVGPCEAHVLAASYRAIPTGTLRDNRGWSDDDWAAAEDVLRHRGWLAETGELTSAGRAFRQHLEDRTDALAAQAFRDGIDDVLALLGPITERVLSSDVIPFPNPIGLPPADG